MEREVPGNTAERICAAPIHAAWIKLISSMLRRSRPRKNRIHDPHDHAPEENGPSHHRQALQVLADLLFQQPRRDRGDDKRDERQAQWMGEDVRSPRCPLGKGGKKFRDGSSKINRQRQNRAELNHDRVHFPKTVAQIEMEERFDDPQMGRRADREEFSQTFDDPEQDGNKIIIHNSVGRPARLTVSTFCRDQSAKAILRTRRTPLLCARQFPG